MQKTIVRFRLRGILAHALWENKEGISSEIVNIGSTLLMGDVCGLVCMLQNSISTFSMQEGCEPPERVT